MSGKKVLAEKKSVERASIHPPLYFLCRGAVVDWAMPRVRDYSSWIHHQ
jgi:hypothetical protein